MASAPFSPAVSSDPQGTFAISGRCWPCLLAQPISGHTASSQTIDPASVLRLNFATLVEATPHPVWLANQLFGEGILDYQIQNELETTDKSSFDKATRLWSAVMTAVKHQRNPTQTLLTVCRVIKQRRELAPLADSMISQLKPQGERDPACCMHPLLDDTGSGVG